MSDRWFEPLARRLAEENRGVAPPPGLVDRIEACLEDRPALEDCPARRRVRPLALLAAAAALALVAAGWWILRAGPAPAAPQRERVARAPTPPPPAPTPGAPESPAPAPPQRMATGPGVPTRVLIDPTSPWLARPVASQSANVTIVLLYREAAAPPPSSPQEGNPS
jgi:hypothetical protein